jgi:multiple sugar transport system ATP-binding protein
MGSEFYAYFEVEAEQVASEQLDELAADAGAEDLSSDATQIVARLDADSSVKQGEEAELFFESDKLHLFDPESGRSLRGRSSERAA